jgi:hypothetical protein
MAGVEGVTDALLVAGAALEGEGLPSSALEIHKYSSEIQRNAEFRYVGTATSNNIRKACASDDAVWRTLATLIRKDFSGYTGEKIKLFSTLLSFGQFLFAGLGVTNQDLLLTLDVTNQ